MNRMRHTFALVLAALLLADVYCRPHHHKGKKDDENGKDQKQGKIEVHKKVNPDAHSKPHKVHPTSVYPRTTLNVKTEGKLVKDSTAEVTQKVTTAIVATEAPAEADPTTEKLHEVEVTEKEESAYVYTNAPIENPATLPQEEGNTESDDTSDAKTTVPTVIPEVNPTEGSGDNKGPEGAGDASTDAPVVNPTTKGDDDDGDETDVTSAPSALPEEKKVGDDEEAEDATSPVKEDGRQYDHSARHHGHDSDEHDEGEEIDDDDEK